MITIGIKYDDIHNEVLRLSEYIAAKAKDYDGLRAIDEDKEQLRSWFLDGLSIANILLDRVIAKRITFTSVTDEVQITLRSHNDAVELVKPALEQMLQYHIIVGWLKLVAPALAPQYQADEQARQQEIMNMCYYREMPK